MKIKMLTTSAGPDVSRNWSKGQKRDVDPEEARVLIIAGVAEALEPFLPDGTNETDYLPPAPPEDETDFTEGGYTAKHKGGGKWVVLNAAGEVVAEDLKKAEAIATADKLTAADAAAV